MIKTDLELIKKYEDAYAKYAKQGKSYNDVIQDLSDSEDYTNEVIAGEYLKKNDNPILDFAQDHEMSKYELDDGDKEIYNLIVSALINKDAQEILGKSISDEYVKEINSNIIEEIIEDVKEISALADEFYYNMDDIKLAIGRVLSCRLGTNLMI